MKELIMSCKTRYPLENLEDVISKGTIRLSSTTFEAGERILGVKCDRSLFVLYVEPIDESNVSEWRRIIDKHNPTIFNNTNTHDVSGYDILWKDFKFISGGGQCREGDIIVTFDGAYIVSSTMIHSFDLMDYNQIVYVCDELPDIDKIYGGTLIYTDKIDICTDLDVRVFLSHNPQIICVNGSRPWFIDKVDDLPYTESGKYIPRYNEFILCRNTLYKIDVPGECYEERYMNLRKAIILGQLYIRDSYRDDIVHETLEFSRNVTI